MDFDPDSYIAKRESAPPQSFDPDAYLAKATPQRELGVVARMAGGLGASPETAQFIDRAIDLTPMANLAKAGNYIGEKLNDMAYATGGAATDLAARMGAAPETAAGIGAVANTLSQVGPQIGASIGRRAAPMLRTAAEGLMTRAVNPSLGDLGSGKAARAISTMLDEGFNPTVSSMAQVRGRINDLRKQINDIADKSPASVDMVNVFVPVKEALKRFSNQVNPKADLATIRKSWDEFLSHPAVGGNASSSPLQIPIKTAQDLKTGTSGILGGRVYGELGTAETEAQKQIVRGLKEGINKAEPAIAPLNQKSAELYNVLNVSERAALGKLKDNPIGMNMLAANPKAMAAYTLGKSARFKAALAHALNQNQESIGRGAGVLAGAGIGGAIGRSEEE